MNNLYLNWLKIERKTKSMESVLRDINVSCGTKYKHNWPSVMRDRGYTLERLPTNVRQYMMKIVLPNNLKQSLSEKELNDLVKSIT